MHWKTIIASTVAAATITGATTAVAQTSNTFGFGGSQPVLTPSCTHGPVDLTGLKTRALVVRGFTITQGDLKCDNLRTTRIIGCAKRANIQEAKPDAQGFKDERGLSEFVACLAGVTGQGWK